MSTLLTTTTELEAVNTILVNDGEARVNTLSEEGFSPAQEALAVLKETSRRVQKKGWNFNTDRGRTLSPDIDGNISLGSNVLDARPTSGGSTIKARGSRLYDATNFTYEFSNDVNMDIVTLLAWEELPEYARDYITIRAARLYQKRETTSDLMDAFTAEDERRAYADFRRNENRAERPNVLRNSFISTGLSGRRI